MAGQSLFVRFSEQNVQQVATEFPRLDFEVGLEVDQDAEGLQVM